MTFVFLENFGKTFSGFGKFITYKIYALFADTLKAVHVD